MQNTSGIKPVEYNVLVKQDDVSAQTKGGLYVPEEVLEREKHAQTRGVIVAVSDLAFDAAIWPEGKNKPEAGQRIAFAKHSGTFVTGVDGEEYRVIKDKDVVAMIEDQ